MILRIRNWGEYQHYKDRCPPWIKLHFKLLSSRDWVVLADASRVLAIACMLIASQADGSPGEFVADADYIKRVAYLNEAPDFKPLIECGFLEVVDGLLADASGCKQKLAKRTTETETETEKKKHSSSTAVDGFTEFWSAYPRKVGKADAVKAWGKIKPDSETVKDIVAAIAVQRESDQWRKHDGQFIPHPATWLNGRRWEDEAQQSANVSDIVRLAI